MIVHAIDVPHQGHLIVLYERTVGPLTGKARALSPITDRHGDSWHAADLVVCGRNGAALATLSLTPSQLRDLAAKSLRLADFTDARAKGLPGPCLCSAWAHNLYPCPNDAALDYSMCRECWTPEIGQSALTMGHGGEHDHATVRRPND